MRSDRAAVEIDQPTHDRESQAKPRDAVAALDPASEDVGQ
jgi:hypothetical protein